MDFSEFHVANTPGNDFGLAVHASRSVVRLHRLLRTENSTKNQRPNKRRNKKKRKPKTKQTLLRLGSVRSLVVGIFMPTPKDEGSGELGEVDEELGMERSFSDDHLLKLHPLWHLDLAVSS